MIALPIRPLLATVLCCGFMLSGKTIAAPGPVADDQWLLAKYDENGDNIITVDEISEKRKQIFERMDGDGTGDVSFGEYRQLDQAKREMLLKARFNKLDLDQDGVLSGEEYVSYLGSFERFDQNGDGSITSEEIASPGSGDRSGWLSKKVKEDVSCLLWFCVRATPN
ncbi:hypothetical protein WKW49_12920 [Teredinibacter turnerae]|nr:hypothetical protein [Teredinibacter turnerae]